MTCHAMRSSHPTLWALVLGAAMALSGTVAAQDPAPVAEEEASQPFQVAGPMVTPPRLPDPATANGTVIDAPIVEITDLDPPPTAKTIDLTVERDDLWDRIRVGFAMPDLTGPLVSARQSWYEARPQLLKTMFERSRRYLYHIVDELEKRGMPTELALLPMVESAFNPMAYSPAHASGLWQFIPSTGKRYELQQNIWYDARRDIVASTNAALDYLQFLYEMHGDWHLALASYNWGENSVARAIDKNRARGLPTNYMSLTMPSETRNYVPKLQALKNIVANPVAFGIDLDPIPNQPYFTTLPATPDIDIRLAARLAEMPVSELVALNPAYNRPVVAGGQNPLVLPADRVDTFMANLQAHDEPLSSWRLYTLKVGDRLDKLAAKVGMSLAKLKQANAITRRTRVGPGFQLLLPVKGSGAATEPLPAVFTPPVETGRGVRTVMRRTFHTVKRGETLASIAERYKVAVPDLRRWNQVGRLMAGQKLVIQREARVSAAPRKVSAPARGQTKRPVHARR